MPALSVALWRNVLVCAAVAPALRVIRSALLCVEKSQRPFFVFYGLVLFPALPGAAGSLSALVPRLPLDGWLVLLALSLVASTLGFGLYTLSMNYLPASVANLLATTEPVMTAIGAYVFLGERMMEIQIVGSSIILLAVLLVRAFEGWRNT